MKKLFSEEGCDQLYQKLIIGQVVKELIDKFNNVSSLLTFRVAFWAVVRKQPDLRGLRKNESFFAKGNKNGLIQRKMGSKNYIFSSSFFILNFGEISLYLNAIHITGGKGGALDHK